MLFGQVEWVQNSKFLQPIMQALAPGYPWYELLDMLGIIFFAYFYVSIIMKPDDIADNFRKSGSFIPGIRPASARLISSTTFSPASRWWVRSI